MPGISVYLQHSAMTPRQLRATHEAGHCVIARALGVKVECATLREVTTLHRRGDAESFRERAVVALAGPAAEERYGGYSDAQMAGLWRNEWRGDFDNVLRYLDAAGGDLFAPHKCAAERLVRKHWAAIERVAAALIERGELSGAEIDRLIARGDDNSVPNAEPRVRHRRANHWHEKAIPPR
jgi:hypothetical protein